MAGSGGDFTTVTTDLSSLSDGTSGFTVTAVAVDDVNNTGATTQVSTVTKDTVAPSVTTFNVTQEDADKFTVEIVADDATTGVDELDLSFSGPGNVVVRTNANNNTAGDTYSFELTYRVDQPGEYTATLESIKDGVDNDGASGETDSANVSAAAEVTYNNDAAVYDGDDAAVQFSVSKSNSDTVQITEIAVDSSDAGADILKERATGSGAGSREVQILASDTGYLEAGDQPNSKYTLGTTTSLTNTAAISGSTDATITLAYFRTDGGGQNDPKVSQRGDTVTVTLVFSDGSTKTIEADVPT